MVEVENQRIIRGNACGHIIRGKTAATGAVLGGIAVAIKQRPACCSKRSVEQEETEQTEVKLQEHRFLLFAWISAEKRSGRILRSLRFVMLKATGFRPTAGLCFSKSTAVGAGRTNFAYNQRPTTVRLSKIGLWPSVLWLHKTGGSIG